MEIPIRCTYDELVPVEELKPNPQNNNMHPEEQINRLAKLIENHGWRLPITVSNQSGFIVRGHGKFLAAKRLGMDIVPVDFQDYENYAQELADLMADNKIPELSFFDDELTRDLLSEIQRIDVDFDMELTGFGDDELRDLLGDDQGEDGNNNDPDNIPDPPAEPKSKLGDLYQLGRHRLLCGDSTKREDVERLMDGEKAEILFTSPPYLNQRTYGGNKDLSLEYIIQFIPCFKPFTVYQVINLGIIIRESEIIEYWQDYIKMAKNQGYKLLSWNIWDKLKAGHVGHQNRMFAIEHEWIFVFGEKEKKLNRTIEKQESSKERVKYYKKDKDGRPIRTMRNQDDTTSYATIGEIYEKKNLGTVLRQYPELSREFTDKHPAIMRVEVPIEYINAMTNKDNIIIDPFGGSGSTLIACEKTNRRCFMMELDPVYIDVIIQRWETFTGQKAVKL